MYVTKEYGSVYKPTTVRDIADGEDMALFGLMEAMADIRDHDLSIGQKLRSVESCLKNINRLRSIMEAHYSVFSALEECFTPEEAGEDFLPDENRTEVDNEN